MFLLCLSMRVFVVSVCIKLLIKYSSYGNGTTPYANLWVIGFYR